jgi:hypothetical protein
MFDKRKFWRNLTRIHKWTALIIGVQIILWTASGVVMSFFNIEDVRGNHIAQEAQYPIDLDMQILSSSTLMTHDDDEVYSTKLRSVVGAPVYEITRGDGLSYIDALNGETWNGVTKDKIEQAAQFYYKGSGNINSVLKLETAPLEYRSILPVWQVSFEDKYKTRLYLNANTADLAAVRTRLWRFYDFMWMLHIMDYKTRDNFNTWWLKIMAFCALLFSLSGAGLVTHRIFLRPRPKNRP